MANASLPHTLETVTGKFVDLVDPDPSDICIEDIAWSLSRLARFNGHTIQAVPYSVAQHSIVVAEEAIKLYRDEDPSVRTCDIGRMGLLALLHDASEAYTGDVSGPLKKVPAFRAVIKPMEQVIQNAIYKALQLEQPSQDDEDFIKGGDLIAQRIEAYNFMVSRGLNWQNVPKVSIVKLQEFEPPVPSLKAYEEFMEAYNEYRHYLKFE